MGQRSFLHRRSVRAVLRGVQAFLWGKRGNRRVHGFRMWTRIQAEAVLHARKALAMRGGRVRIWFDGSQAFPRIFKLIERAKHSVVVHMFIWHDDLMGRELASLLVRVADSGVRVEITKETTGDLFELNEDFLSTREKPSGIWKQFWGHPGISVEFTTEGNHSKVFVIDDSRLLIGSMNVADAYVGSWDFLVEIRDRRLVRRYLADDNGRHAGAVRLLLNTPLRSEIRPGVESLLRSARHSVIVQHSYLGDSRIMHLLAEATQRGVLVKLYIPEHADACQNVNLDFVQKLMSLADPGNLAIRLLSGFMHGKIIMVDKKHICVGSANLMAHSLDHMGETNVLFEARGRTLHKIRRYFLHVSHVSVPMGGMPRLGLLRKLLASFGL